ncbi:FliM/FliN family flagellar motor switch protein [Planctomicrobium sp. SH664]|uniref:FliM/FliN family flagellar motor switch protein n=1 Tax=Planctomicrobium sp. SH664 TaxID=3448125 RepID=UPI003F5C7840
MSEIETLKILDFKSPRRPSTDAFRQLSMWLASTCTVAQESWSSLLSHPVELKSVAVDPAQLRSTLQRLPEDGLGVYLSIGEAHLPSMIVFTARQVRGLIADLLELSEESATDCSRLSAVESAMLELLFQKLAEAMGDAWPGSTPLKCRYLDLTARPQRTRLFPMDSALLVGRLQLTSRFGEETCHWLLLKEGTERLIFDELGEAPAGERESDPALASLTERIPVEMVVELGTAQLSMSQIERLNVGDVLLLDQFLNRPALARVEGTPKWAGLPVRIGSRQAFEITHLIHNETNLGLLNGSGPSILTPVS